ncbi:developmental pluripotency-associated protein 2 [Peromyscus californicus insignis]|uniref:developmental pluripotency-associated protein 2 n=1 Tax=Peromyscus californicus insignis TaxID=564181 RepID=UPI0022A7114B|nr:developmental pluripotency-associated protein 2 [Peromyscus californicus insignis]
MAQCSQDVYNESFCKEEIDEENVILTLVPVTEEPIIEVSTESTISSPIGLQPPVPPVPTFEASKPPASLRVPHLPAVLPPINDVSRNTLREWCRYHNLSTDGKKIDVYKRLQKNSYSKQQCHIPDTSLEARLKPLPRKPKTIVTKGSKPENLKSSGGEETSIVEVLTSERESVFATWGRIAMRATQPRNVNRQPLPSNVKAFLPPATGYRWCVVHGRMLPADKAGWVYLQMHAGHAWVPDTPQRMMCLFLLPACVFPTPGVEDNLLCPECVHSNRKMLRNFESKKRSAKKHKKLSPNLPT